jgi:hypothetical protein
MRERTGILRQKSDWHGIEAVRPPADLPAGIAHPAPRKPRKRGIRVRIQRVFFGIVRRTGFLRNFRKEIRTPS